MRQPKKRRGENGTSIPDPAFQSNAVLFLLLLIVCCIGEEEGKTRRKQKDVNLFDSMLPALHLRHPLRRKIAGASKK
jgi:hypothetical protein